MSFNFGNTSNTGLGATSTPAKPNAFGNLSFGGAATTTSTFGSNTATPSMGFGATPAFGTANFGAASTGLGLTTTTNPSFGGFGGFGTTTAAPTAFSGFGTTTSAPTAFSGFGTTTSAPSFGGFGTNTSTTNAFGGLGSTASTTGFGGFGTSTGLGFGGLGATATTSAPLFSGFGGGTTSSTAGFGGIGGGFGTGANTAFGGFGSTFGQQNQQQQQQQQQQQLHPDDAFAQSIFNVSIYSDERDTVIAKWNYLQAMWGSGKAFYSQSAEPVEITPQNYLCRFKAVGFSRLPGKDNKSGLVSLIFNKPITDFKNQQAAILTHLHQVFGNRPNVMISYESIKSLPESKTQAIIYVEEKLQQSPNETRRILATDVSNFLNQDSLKPQLNSVGIEQVLALVMPDEYQLKQYLENPPKGIDPRMWRQAKLDNPDPEKFIPVPMIGFNELKRRIKCQENETETHVLYLAKVEKDIAELKQRHVLTTAKIMEYRRKLAELSHKILKIIVKQESTRKVGVALSPEEEVLRGKLENMQAVVSAPTQFKGRLSELLSQMRMQRNHWSATGSSAYSLDKDAEEEMKSFLTMQQKTIKFMIDTANKDMKALKVISDGMTQLTHEK